MQDLPPRAKTFYHFFNAGLSSHFSGSSHTSLASYNLKSSCPSSPTSPRIGYLSNVGDVQGMSEQAIKILEDPAVLQQFKDNAVAHARRFDINTIVPEYEALYNRFLP